MAPDDEYPTKEKTQYSLVWTHGVIIYCTVTYYYVVLEVVCVSNEVFGDCLDISTTDMIKSLWYCSRMIHSSSTGCQFARRRLLVTIFINITTSWYFFVNHFLVFVFYFLYILMTLIYQTTFVYYILWYFIPAPITDAESVGVVQQW